MSEYPRSSIETIRDRVKTNDDFSEADRNAILEFSDTVDLLGQAEYSDERHEFILMRVAKLAQEVGGVADALKDEEAAKPLVRWINQTYDNPESNKDYRTALRTYGRIVTDGDDVPDSLEWIPGGYPKNYDPAPDPAEMLKWDDDIRPMIDACHNLRDKAIIALAWDLGPRPGELFDLEVGSIADHEHGLQVTLDGKTGRRSPILVPSVTFVQQWLNNHPAPDDPNAALWTRTTTAKAITAQRIRDMLKERADDAGVSKPVTPSNFRKSSASYLASRVSQSILEDHHGWTRGSDIAARYIAVFDEVSDREIAKAHGVEIEESETARDGPGRVSCPRCERDTPGDQDTCVWCGQALTHEAVAEATDRRTAIAEELAEIEDEHTRSAIAQIFNLHETPPADGS